MANLMINSSHLNSAPIYECCNGSDVINYSVAELGQAKDYSHNKTLFQIIAEGSLLSLISLCAVFGNSLVILSVYTNRKLRTITNCFVVSLASADLLVGILVLPLSIKVEITGTWQLGNVLCDMWTSCDVMLCTASILNLCCISVDRFFAITKPLVYATKRSKNLALIMIAAVWVVSIIITCPPIFGWQEEGRGERDIFCYLTKDPGYVIYSSLGSFFMPLLVMIFVYARIFQVTRKRNEMLKPFCTTFVFDKSRGFKRWRRDTTNRHATVASTCTLDSCLPNHVGNSYTNVHTAVASYEDDRRRCNQDFDEQVIHEIKQNGCNAPNKHRRFEVHPLRQLHSNSSTGSASSADVALNDARGHARDAVDSRTNTPSSVRRVIAMDTSTARALTRTSSVDAPTNDEREFFLRRDEKRRERALLQRESKTAKTLAVVVGCFVVCWLPFFLMYVVEPFCDNCTFDPVMTMLFTWLGYCNSALNPLIYAFYNRDFRSSFWKLTLGHFARKKPPKL